MTRKLALPLLLALPFLLAAAAPAKKPELGMVFYFEPNGFRFINADVEFRDPLDKKWPNFFIGRPAPGGTFTYDPAHPKASFSIVYDRMTQPAGDQSRKVLGDLYGPDKPPVVTFTVNSMAPFATETVEVTGRKGSTTRQVEYSQLDATLQIDTLKIAIKPKATFSYHTDKDGNLNRVTCDAHVTLKASDLHLKSMPPDAEVKIRLTANGTPNKASDTKKKGK